MSCALKLSRFAPQFRVQAGSWTPCLPFQKFQIAININIQTKLFSGYRGCTRLPENAPVVSEHVNLKVSHSLQIFHSCGFHTSPQHNIPPVVFMLLKPVAKLATIITGRNFRKWWRRQTPEKKQHYKNEIRKRKPLIGVVLGLLGIAAVVHYFTHVQSTPVTNRRRYVALNSEQFLKIAQFECERRLRKVSDKVVSTSHPAYMKVVDVTGRIVRGNRDLEFFQKQNWTIVVVESDDVNAFVLPTGHIFVNTGLLKVTENDDQLAVVLGHEIAHALLGHGAEQVSLATVMDVVIIIVLGAIWAFLPTDGIAVITEWFYNKIMQLLLRLPYSRKLELEADEVGLQLIAKACYDVRESTVFWSSLAARNELEDNDEVPQLISTHPGNLVRAKKLDKLIPEAMKHRERCNCPVLSETDPRAKIAALVQLLKEKRKQNQQQSQPPVSVHDLTVIKPSSIHASPSIRSSV